MEPDAHAPELTTETARDPLAHKRWNGQSAVPVCVVAEAPVPGIEYTAVLPMREMGGVVPGQ